MALGQSGQLTAIISGKWNWIVFRYAQVISPDSTIWVSTKDKFSTKEFCLHSGVNYWTFREWRRKLATESAGNDFVELSPLLPIDSR